MHAMLKICPYQSDIIKEAIDEPNARDEREKKTNTMISIKED
jgi:hypothetical protein